VIIADNSVKKKLKKEEVGKRLQEIGIETGRILKKLQELCNLHNLLIKTLKNKG